MKHVRLMSAPKKAECAVIDFINGALDLLERIEDFFGIDFSDMIKGEDA